MKKSLQAKSIKYDAKSQALNHGITRNYAQTEMIDFI
jgi:hypothetical protein